MCRLTLEHNDSHPQLVRVTLTTDDKMSVLGYICEADKERPFLIIGDRPPAAVEMDGEQYLAAPGLTLEILKDILDLWEQRKIKMVSHNWN